MDSANVAHLHDVYVGNDARGQRKAGPQELY